MGRTWCRRCWLGRQPPAWHTDGCPAPPGWRRAEVPQSAHPAAMQARMGGQGQRCRQTFRSSLHVTHAVAESAQRLGQPSSQAGGRGRGRGGGQAHGCDACTAVPDSRGAWCGSVAVSGKSSTQPTLQGQEAGWGPSRLQSGGRAHCLIGSHAAGEHALQQSRWQRLTLSPMQARRSRGAGRQPPGSAASPDAVPARSHSPQHTPTGAATAPAPSCPQRSAAAAAASQALRPRGRQRGTPDAPARPRGEAAGCCRQGAAIRRAGRP